MFLVHRLSVPLRLCGHYVGMLTNRPLAVAISLAVLLSAALLYFVQLRANSVSLGEVSNKLRIAVVTTVTDREKQKQYGFAMDTFRCYCLHAGYDYVSIAVSENRTLTELCPQSHYFQRHCIVAHFLEDHSYPYILFVDADMGIINPERRIEEFIVDGKDLIFYNRIWSHEIMSGSYIAKKSKFSIEVLHLWASFDYKRPRSPAVDGVDNGALHPLLLAVGGLDVNFCSDLWNASRSTDDLFVYEECVRMQLDANASAWEKRIAILAKGTSWARDGWLTKSEWCPKDFVFHGWQKWRENANAVVFARWISPFTSHDLDMQICSGPLYKSNWKYKPNFIRPCDAINDTIQKWIAEEAVVEVRYKASVKEFLKRKRLPSRRKRRAVGLSPTV